MKENYRLSMEKVIAGLPASFSDTRPPRLLLHSCCAPCSSSVIKQLADYFQITVFYYNPNIDTQAEYLIRAGEQSRLIMRYNEERFFPYQIDYQLQEYKHETFIAAAKGLETYPEGGERCFRCYRLRLEATAKAAAEQDFDFYCTTLSISPLKNAAKINEIGFEYATERCRWLPNDFKKKDGYLNSIKLSKEFGLYRQDYCGCEYSLRHPAQNKATDHNG